tara:strand:- start:165 stop:917 length:753 start_codon:yes stop_codon:yes gene_type:complete
MNKRNIKKFRKDLKQGKTLIGGWIQISNSNIAEIMSNAHYSWIGFDMEHGSFSIGDLPDLFRSVEINNKLALVRLPNKNLEICSQVLDAGCAGVIIPNIKNEIELNLLKKACYLPPYGSRGVGFSRANLFGKNINRQNNKPIIIAMIENINSAKHLEKILLVQGLDAILIGPYDLSASMGMTGKFNNSKFKLIIEKIKQLSKKFKVPCGIHVLDPNYKVLMKYAKLGYQFLPYSTDTVLLSSALKSSFKK